MAKELAYTKDAVPNDTTFKEKLMSENLYKNRNLCRYLLSILENGINTIKESVVIDGDVSIEHILPQNKDNQWWRNEIGDNYDVVYDRYVHTLGNLSLTGYNSELSDNTFTDKVLKIKEKSKFVYLNADVIDKEHWNEKSISARAQRLSGKLIQDLKLPEVFGKTVIQTTDNSHRVDDVFDYTGMKVASFIFLGENREVSSVKEMLVKFSEVLYNLDSEKLQEMANTNWRSANATAPLFSCDKTKLRTPAEVFNTGIYVETNRSSNDVVRSIKYLLNEYGLDLDDFVFYTVSN